YANIAPGATGANSLSFRLATTSAFGCGSSITLTLSITYTGGSDVVTFTIPSGSGVGSPTAYESVDVPKAIIDLGTINSVLTVSGFVGGIGKVTASMYATHTWDEDLDIFLIGPDGTTVELTSDNGGNGDNYGSACGTRTVFDDAAATSITAGTAPFVGTFRPEGSLAAFNGKSGAAANGTWTLRITDDVGADVGTLQCWGITLAPATCTDGGGECSALPIQLASFTGSVINGNTVRLDWMTISEINNYGFEVQKSTQQLTDFVTIPGSFVPGHGTTNEPNYYSYNDVSVSTRSAYYRLKQIDLDGSLYYTDAILVNVLTDVGESSVPVEFSLAQNYPNPFNPSTAIRYGLPVASEVKLEVFNTLGQRVIELVNERQEAGFHSTTFEGTSFASGVYIYKIQAGGFVATKKFLLLK
ncbi:MAG: hemagluttinin repeat-containing protein, partial [Bacteroidetes bacterium]|nr:hemagluttinin repeat-containing protein [Bacteroidota bacterium]